MNYVSIAWSDLESEIARDRLNKLANRELYVAYDLDSTSKGERLVLLVSPTDNTLEVGGAAEIQVGVGNWTQEAIESFRTALEQLLVRRGFSVDTKYFERVFRR